MYIVCSVPLKINKKKCPQGRNSVSNYVIYLFDRKVSGTNRVNLFAQNSLMNKTKQYLQVSEY